MNRFSIDDLIIFNDELLALSQAGISLHVGLAAASSDLGGTLKQSATAIASEMESGVSLEDALENRPMSFPSCIELSCALARRPVACPAR